MLKILEPSEDLKFLMRAVGDLDSVLAFKRFAGIDSEIADAAVDAAAAFCQGELAPLNRIGDQNPARCTDGLVTTPPGFPAAFKAFSEAGFNGVSASPVAGGLGLPKMIAACVEELTSNANLAFSLCPVLNRGAIAALSRFGTRFQQEVVLPRLVSGEWTGTMNLTEAQAGSDLGAIRTRAEPLDDHYSITGQKIFITYGEQDYTSNIVHLVLARLPDAPPGPRGISLFMVPKFLIGPSGQLGKRNGVYCLSVERKLGLHGSPTCVMSYGEKDIAHGWLIGKENRGLEAMFVMMNEARFAVGVEGVAQCQAALELASRYAHDRVQGRPLDYKGIKPLPIAAHPDVARLLLRIRSFTEGGRAMSIWIASLLDRADAHTDAQARTRALSLSELAVPIFKAWATERSIDAANMALQIHGGSGYIEETGVAQILRDTRVTTIYEGTTAIQANDLWSRKILRDGGANMNVLLDEFQGTCHSLLHCADSQLKRLAASLQKAISSVRVCVNWIVQIGGSQPRVVAAGAVPFLEVCGGLAAAVLLCRAALHASRQDHAVLARNKRVVASYFINHELLPALSRVDAVMNSAQDILEMASIDEQISTSTYSPV